MFVLGGGVEGGPSPRAVARAGAGPTLRPGRPGRHDRLSGRSGGDLPAAPQQPVPSTPSSPTTSPSFVALSFPGVIAGCAVSPSGRWSAALGVTCAALIACSNATASPTTRLDHPASPKGDRLLGIDVSAAEDGDYNAAFGHALRTGMDFTSLTVFWDDLEPTPTSLTPEPDYLAIADAYYPVRATAIVLDHRSGRHEFGFACPPISPAGPSMTPPSSSVSYEYSISSTIGRPSWMCHSWRSATR